MASNYKQIRCQGCGGTLKYVKEKKVWECIYCGNEIRREEEYDGLYTIKNVVKQVLVDLAYQRMDSALKNLVECQKISSDYVGTLIAEICLKVFTLITPGACQQSEMRGIMGQVKRLYTKLEELGDNSISTEEEALYEAFDDNSDAFGVLVLVFDTLRAKVHLDFVLDLFDASTVYSVSLNTNLLNYALKNSKADMVDKIFANSDNINCRDALFILLKVYPDAEQKRQRIDPIMSKAQFESEDHRQIEEYLSTTDDGLETKILVYRNAVKYGITPSMQKVAANILDDPDISDEQISEVYRTFCSTRPNDSELYDLISQIYTKHSGKTAVLEMNELVNNDIFIKLTDKVVREMVTRKDLTVEDRITLLEESEECKLNAKDNDYILAEILLRDNEEFDARLALVSKMITYVDTISTNTLTEYIVKSTVDGDHKPEMLEEIMKLDLNMSFFRGVLNNYVKYSADSGETKSAVASLLSSQGISADGGMLLDMAVNATDSDYMDKAAFIQKSISNGTRVNAECLSDYLEKVAPENYHSELISLFDTSVARVSDKALAKYVLYSDDTMDVKVANAVSFALKNGKTFGESPCEIKHLNASIKCNLFQAYVLRAGDSAAAMETITAEMKKAGAKLNPSIYVNGQMVKFKKYASDNKAQLSPMTLQMCEDNKVFSFFF